MWAKSEALQWRIGRQTVTTPKTERQEAWQAQTQSQDSGMCVCAGG